MHANHLKTPAGHTAALLLLTMLPGCLLADPIKVTAFNFVRAESDHQMASYVDQAGGIGRLVRSHQCWAK